MSEIAQEGQPIKSETLFHASSEFSFVIQCASVDAFPLFGGLGERMWAGDTWNPDFLYPQPAADVCGEVFTTTEVLGVTTWVNTAFDSQRGHVQYVYFVPAVQVTVIEIYLIAKSDRVTEVRVRYDRTALQASMNSTVQRLHQHDHTLGHHWETSINSYCAKRDRG